MDHDKTERPKGLGPRNARPGAAADLPPQDPVQDTATADIDPTTSVAEEDDEVLLPDLAELPDPAISTTLARLFRFLPEDGDGDAAGDAAVRAIVARERPLASLDEAIGELVACVAELYDLTAPMRYKVESLKRDAPKVGRNDPCPCGSGRKFKQCHGAAPSAAR